MMKRQLNIADGQLAATATEITAGAGDVAKRLNLTFCNTGSAEETIILTLTRSGGTARRIKRVVLQENEQFELGGFPLNSDASLKGYTTNGGVVDFTVSIAAEESLATYMIFDADGVPKILGNALQALTLGAYND
jgi:hypothetical protein